MTVIDTPVAELSVAETLAAAHHDQTCEPHQERVNAELREAGDAGRDDTQ